MAAEEHTGVQFVRVISNMLTKLVLQNFRNFDEKVVEFSQHTSLILGPNASGKSSILEAIATLSTAKWREVSHDINFNFVG